MCVFFFYYSHNPMQNAIYATLNAYKLEALAVSDGGVGAQKLQTPSKLQIET